MNEQQIRELIRQEIKQDNAASRFQLTPVQSHDHDGINSTVTYQPTFTYVGRIRKDGTVLFLPRGWRVTKEAGLGAYTILHNLNTDKYIVTAAPTLSQTTIPVCAIELFPSKFTILWASSMLGAGADFEKDDTDFGFLLTVINNSNSNLPVYNTKIQ